MKKLLALVLSITMLLTMFSGTLGVFAADTTTTATTPAAYSGSLPQDAVDVFGFEGATIGTAAEATYHKNNSITNWSGSVNTGDTTNYEIVDDAYSGKNALKITFDESNTNARLGSKFVDIPDDWYASGNYTVTAMIKTTPDFNGHVALKLTYGGAHSTAISNNHSWTETYLVDCTTGDTVAATNSSGSRYAVDKRVDPSLLGGWTKVNSGKHNMYYTGISNWIAQDGGVGVYLLVSATAGSVWIDDISIETQYGITGYGATDDTCPGYDGVFTADKGLEAYGGSTGAGTPNNGGFERSAGYWSATMMVDKNSTNGGSISYIAGYGNQYQAAVTETDEEGNTVVVTPRVLGQDVDIKEVYNEKYTSKNGIGQINWDTAHNGYYSFKVYKGKEAKSSFAFFYPSADIDTTKDYYLEAYVKLDDDFVGTVESSVAIPTFNTINTPHTWFGSTYMLGSNKFNITTEDVGDGWVHITSSVMDGAVIYDSVTDDEGNITNAALNFYLTIGGTGLIYIDDINLVECDENTPKISTKDFYSSVTFSTATLTTESADTAIWFTDDGSNPLYSPTAKIYDAENPIRIYDNLNIKAVGINKTTGAVSDIISHWFTAPADLYKIRTAPVDDKAPIYYDELVLPADAAAGEEVRLTSSNVTSAEDSTLVTEDSVMQFRGYGMKNSFTLSFDVTAAEDFTGETWVKLFLNGGGEFRVDFNGTTANGTFVGENGYVAKITEPGTQTVTLKLEGLQSHDAMAPFIERISGSGEVKVNNYKLVIDQVGLGTIDVVEEEAPELNYYIQDYYIDVFPTFTNNSGYHLEGTMDVIYTAQDGNSVYSTSFDVNLASGEAYSDWFDISAVIKEYGAYDLQYVFTDSRGFSHVCLEKAIAYLPNNSDADAFRGVNLGVFGVGYDTAYAQLELVKNLGMSYVRTEIRIDNENIVTATLDETGAATAYTLADTVAQGAQAAQDAGIDLVVLLNATTSTVDIDEYVLFAETVKAALADYGIKYYEIINEPNGSSAAKYAQIVKAAYPVLHDDNTMVQVGNVSHHGGGWLEDMIAADADILDYIDIWTVHPYAHNNYSESATWEDATFVEYLNTLKTDYLDPNGIELWAGEFGYPTADTCQRDSTGLYEFGFDEEYAEYTLRQYLGLEAGGYGAAIQYVYGGNNNYWGEQSFGLVDKSDRTAVSALSGYTYLTKGYDFVEQTIVDGVYTNKYQNADGAVIYAIWTTSDSATATVSIPSADYGIADMYGNKSAYREGIDTVDDASTMTVTATGEPVWVVPFVDTYVEPIENNYIKNGSMEVTPTSVDQEWVYEDVVSEYDPKVSYDGYQSLKVSFNTNGSTRLLFKTDYTGLDYNKLYTLRFKYRSEGYDGEVVPYALGISNGTSVRKGIWNGEMFANFTLPDTAGEWATYESTSFSIIDAGLYFGYYFKSGATDNGCLWIDAVELVPVEGSGSEYGTISKLAWDADNSKILVTATPAAGYHVDTFTAKLVQDGANAIKTLNTEQVSIDYETGEVVYAVTKTSTDGNSASKYITTGLGTFKFLDAVFTPGYAVIENNRIADGNCEIAFNGLSADAADESLDTEVYYDGAASYKMVTTTTGGGVNFSRAIDLSDLDLNTQYKIRFKYKTVDAQLKVDLIPNASYNGTKVVNYRYGMWNGELETNTLHTENTTTDGWATFESSAFSIVGDSFSMQFNFKNNSTAETSTVWFDRFELVPVDTSDRHGIVTSTYDAENSRILVTATPDEGYEVNFMPQLDTNDGNVATVVAMKNELVSVDETTGAKTYAVEFVSAEDGTTVLNTYYKDAGYVIFKTAFTLPSIVDNASMEQGLPSSWDSTFSTKASIDTTVKYDGLQSMKLSLDAGGSTNFVQSIPTSVMENLDVSVQYKAVIRMKGSVDSTYSVAVDPRAYATNTDGSRYEYDFDYRWMYGGEILFGQNVAVSTEWATYESASFSLLGEDIVLLWPISNKGSEAVNLWIDSIQIVPAEENTSNGVVTQTIDDDGNVVFTAKANEGYMLDTLAVYGTTAYADAAAEITSTYVGQYAVDEVAYSANLAGYKTFTGKGYNIVKATFVEIPAADDASLVMGDANGDGSADIIDLVRFKNFELGNVNSIEYVNVWYDRTDKVLGATDLAELRKQIWNNF